MLMKFTYIDHYASDPSNFIFVLYAKFAGLIPSQSQPMNA